MTWELCETSNLSSQGIIDWLRQKDSLKTTQLQQASVEEGLCLFGGVNWVVLLSGSVLMD